MGRAIIDSPVIYISDGYHELTAHTLVDVMHAWLCC